MKFNEEELARIKAVVLLDTKKRPTAEAIYSLVKQKKSGIGQSIDSKIIDTLFAEDSIGIFSGADAEKKFAKLQRIYTTLLKLLQRDQALAKFIADPLEEKPNTLFYNLIELLNENEDSFIPETSHNLEKVIKFLGLDITRIFPELNLEELARAEESVLASLPGTAESSIEIISTLYGCNVLEKTLLIPREDSDLSILKTLADIPDFEGEIIEGTATETGPSGIRSKRDITYLKLNCPENFFVCFNATKRRQEVISLNQILDNIFFEAYLNRHIRKKDPSSYSYETSINRLFLTLQFHPDAETVLRSELNGKYRTIFDRSIESGLGFGLQHFANDHDLAKILFDVGTNTLAYIFFGYQNLKNKSLNLSLRGNKVFLSHDSEDVEKFINHQFLSLNDHLIGIKIKIIDSDEGPYKKIIAFDITDPFLAIFSSSPQALQSYLEKNASDLEKQNAALISLYKVFVKTVDNSLKEISQLINHNFKLKEGNLFTFPFTAENFKETETLRSLPLKINNASKGLAKRISELKLDDMRFIYDETATPRTLCLEISKSADFSGNMEVIKGFFRIEYDKTSIDDLAALIEGSAKKATEPKAPKQKNKSATSKPSSSAAPLAAIATATSAPIILPSPKSAPPSTLPIEELVIAAAPLPPTQEDPKPIIEALTKEKLVKDLETFLKNRAKRLKMILGSDLQEPIINFGENFLLVSFTQSQNPEISSDPLIKTDFNIHTNNLIFYADLRDHPLEEIKEGFFNIIKNKILTKKPLVASESLAAFGSSEDHKTISDTKTLQQEMEKFFYNRSLLDCQITEPEALCTLITKTIDLSSLLDEISSGEDHVHKVLVYGSILHNKFPGDVDISLIIPGLTLNSEENINRFFGAALPKGDFAIPTPEQKLAIFSKIRIPKHLQDSCQIAIQGGEKNSFLRIKLGKDIDITCSGDVRSIGWTSSLDGTMLDWRSKTLVTKHGFTPDATEFVCNKEVFQTHFRVIHSIFPNILDRDNPRDGIILNNHDNLFSQIIRTPSYRLPQIKADQEEYIEKHEMTIKKATYFRYNFALLLETLFNKFPLLFPVEQKEEIAEDLKIYKSFIEDYEKDMGTPKELCRPVEGSGIGASHSRTRQ